MDILVSAPNIVLDYPSNNITVSTPNYSTIATSQPDISLITNIPDLTINVTTANLGEENIPQPGLFKYTPEVLLYSDRIAITIAPKLLDSKTLSDTVKYALNKGVPDISSIVEKLSFSSSKVLYDYASTSDLLSIFSEKIVEDELLSIDQLIQTWNINRSYYDLIQTTDDVLGDANIDDDQYVTFGKGLVDNSSLSDILISTWNINRTYSDILSSTDYIGLHSNKGIIDSTDVLDNISFISIKDSTDTVIYSDTVNSIWYIDREYNEVTSAVDYIGKAYSKSTSDLASFNDTISIYFNNAEADSAYIYDSLSIDIINAELDSINSIEKLSVSLVMVEEDNTSLIDTITSNWDINRVPIDTFSLSDRLYIAVTNAETDSISTIEKLSIDFTNAELDSSILIDQVYTEWNIGRNYIDSSLSLEQLYLSINKPISDLIQSTDDVLGMANIDDDQYALVGKGVVDYSTLTESVSFLFITGRVFSEVLPISETKDAIVQNYYSSDFVVPYYVGTLYTL